MNSKSSPCRMDNLKRLRKEQGYTCESLGLLVGVKKSAMSKYERGEIQPSKQVLMNISDALGCSVDYLLQREAGPDQRVAHGGIRWASGTEAFDGLTLSELGALSRIAQIFKEQRNSDNLS